MRAFSDIRPLVFWPPAFLLLVALAFSVISFDAFLAGATAINNFILKNFGWLITSGAALSVTTIVAILISPIGNVRIGGAEAKPLLKRWNWFAITLCTTIATGILFWGVAEPLFHVAGPPQFADAEPNSPEAARFALSTMFMHWAITPYAIYAVPSLAFALAYYNLGKNYSLGGTLSIAWGPLGKGAGAAIVDALALFALIAGVAASLGAGVLTLTGGAERVLGVDDTIGIRFLIILIIVFTYVASSISGLQKGIKILSDLNIRIFLFLALVVFAAGPSVDILRLGGAALVDYVADFLPRSVMIDGGEDREWMRSWTVFYFANWMAWAPITSLFLGRIAFGYTVREFVLFSLVAPACFSIIWMTIFSGATLSIEAAQPGVLQAALQSLGPESVIYAVFDFLPFAAGLSLALIFTTYISFVTAMDSNTHSIASVCLRAGRQSDELAGQGQWIKIFWGALIGAVSFIMTATNGIDGIRMLSNLGGAPGVLILLGSIAVLVRLLLNPAILGQSKDQSVSAD